MIYLKLKIPFTGNKMKKLFVVRGSYRHCYVRVIMRPSGWVT